MSDLREKIMADEEIIASKRRFGLFSQPPPLAVGDDGAYQKKKSIQNVMQLKKDKMANQLQNLRKCYLGLAGRA